MYSEHPYSAAPYSDVFDDDITLPEPTPEPESEASAAIDPITSGPWVRRG